MIKGIIQEEDISLLNIYSPNIGAPKYVNQLLMDIKGDIYRNTVIIGYFNTPTMSMDKSSRQKISKDRVPLNDKLV